MAPGDHHLRPLSNDVPPQPDPRPADQFQPQSNGLPERTDDALRQTRRLEHDEQATRHARKRGQTMEAVRDAGKSAAGPSRVLRARVRVPGARVPGVEAGGQIHQEHVHRTTLQDRAGDAEAFVQGVRRQDNEPLQPDTACHGLNGVKRAGQIEVGDDGAAGLGLCDQSQCEGGLAAGRVSVHGDAGQPGNAARPQDGVQGSEAGMDDAAVINVRGTFRRPVVKGTRGRGRDGLPSLFHVRPVKRKGSECTDRERLFAVPAQPWSCRAPASLESRESGSDLGRRAGHLIMIEHMFYWSSAGSRPSPAPLSRSPNRSPNRSSGGHLLYSAARGDVAQPEEHRVRIAGVRGSSPLISTTSAPVPRCARDPESLPQIGGGLPLDGWSRGASPSASSSAECSSNEWSRNHLRHVRWSGIRDATMAQNAGP